MDNLPTFTDLCAVVNWLEELTIGVTTPSWKIILDIFGEHGFLPDMNTGTEFNAEDESNFAHWLVGQALSGLQYEPVHAVHQIYHKFADEWRQKFGHESNA